MKHTESYSEMLVKQQNDTPAMLLMEKKLLIQEKLEVFSEISSDKIKQNYQTIKQPLKDLFDLRNRLAHFKDEAESIDLSTTVENTHENGTNITIEHFKSMM